MATTFTQTCPADLDRLVSCLVAAAAQEGRAVDGDLLGAALGWMIGEGGGCCWLVERDGLFAGVFVLEPGPGDQQPRYAYAPCLYLTPAFRGQGLGDLIRGFLRSVATGLGCRLAMSEADPAHHECRLPLLPIEARGPSRARRSFSQTMRAA